MDWISENFLAICAILVAVLVPIGIFVYQRRLNRKRLSYEVVYGDEIVKSNSGVAELKFIYKGREISDLFLVAIRVVNDGRKEISSTDFESPLVFNVGDEATILNHTLVRRNPNNIELDFTITDNSVTITPTLLNSKDEFIFQLLVTNSSKLKLVAKARIKGISSITKTKKPFADSRVNIFGATVAISIIIAGLISKTSENVSSQSTIFKVVLLSFAVFYAITLGISIFKSTIRPSFNSSTNQNKKDD